MGKGQEDIGNKRDSMRRIEQAGGKKSKRREGNIKLRGRRNVIELGIKERGDLL